MITSEGSTNPGENDMSSIREKIVRNARLVSLPAVYLRLKAVLEDPGSNLADVADVVSNDPALTARLLRLVNSAYFGLATKIDTVTRAISLLGTQEVHDLTLAVSVTQSFEGMSNDVMDMQSFWHKSVGCAIAARELAGMCNLLDSERLFVAGMLRDIGHLSIYQAAPHEAQEAIRRSRAERIPLHQVERALLGVDYAQVGAELMRHWQLPQSLWEPTECHPEPENSQQFELMSGIVHIAAAMTEAIEYGDPLEPALDHVAPIAWELTGLSAHQCIDAAMRIEPQVVTVVNLMFPTRLVATA